MNLKLNKYLGNYGPAVLINYYPEMQNYLCEKWIGQMLLDFLK